MYAFQNTDYDKDIENNPFQPQLLTSSGEGEDNSDTTLGIIKTIQFNERGRQGRDRYMHNYISDKRDSRKIENLSEYNTIKLQKAFRAYLAKLEVYEMREKELEFLGMKYTPSQNDLEHAELRDQNRSVKKLIQIE